MGELGSFGKLELDECGAESFAGIWLIMNGIVKFQCDKNVLRKYPKEMKEAIYRIIDVWLDEALLKKKVK